tara:strand:+ start:136 stop:426 length:291 start_codon:yes stop_codon:yes gene_type:complete
MIIEPKYKTGDTVSFKLTSGEELVARFDGFEGTEYKLHKPMVLIMQQQGMGLAPFMFSVSSDAKFFLQPTSVACIAKTESEIAKQYTSTTTGVHLI